MREPNNPYNEQALKLVTQSFNEIVEDHLKVEGRWRLLHQFVRDIFYETAGHVPANITRTLAKGMAKEKRIHAHV